MPEEYPTVYWFASPDTGVYQDDIVSIVDGLQQLGVQVVGSRDYWIKNVGRDYLLKSDPDFRPEDADIVVCSWTWLRSFGDEFKATLRQPPSYFQTQQTNQIRVLVDLDDGYQTPSFGSSGSYFDLVLRCKYNKRCFHPENHVPWALGLSQRVLEALPSDRPAYGNRRNAMLLNFGASHPFSHGTRELFSTRFSTAVESFMDICTRKDDLSERPENEQDALMWEQTQKRHSSDYYQRLASSKAIAAFCGEMIPPAPFEPNYLVGGKKALLKRRFFEIAAAIDKRPSRSIQWDSWRFWEGLAAGCLVFNIDLEYYGIELPVMPENGKHYVGLRLEDIETQVQSVLSNESLMESIAANGKTWVEEYYSPKGLAKQFLEIVNKRALVS